MRLIVELLTMLHAEGYPLGPGKLMQLEELLRQLPPDLPPAALRTQLAPLFAGSPEEQRRFYELFDKILHRVETPGKQEESTGTGLPDTGAKSSPEPEMRWGALFLGILLTLCALSGAMFEPQAPLTWLLLATAMAGTAYASWKMAPVGLSRRMYLLGIILLAAAGYFLKTQVVQRKTAPPTPPSIRSERFAVEQGRTATRALRPAADTARLLSISDLSSKQGLSPLGNQAVIDTAAAALRYTAAAGAEPGSTDSILIALQYPARTDTLLLLADILAAAPPERPGTEEMAELPLPFPRNLQPLEIDPEAQAIAELYRRWQWPLKGLLFLLLAAAAWAYARWDQRRRERFVAEIEQRDQPPYIWRIETGEEHRLDFEDNLSLLLNRLRRREGAEGRRLDLRATVRASIKHAGRASFVFREQTRPPEYLLLIDRFDANDHLARLFDALYTELRRAEVPVERFFYQGDPRVCFNEAHPEGVPLSDLAHRLHDARLLLVGEGQRLLMPSSGALAPWTKLFEGWRRRALLLPKPTRTWGMREKQLADLFALVPASVEGLDLALEQFETLERRSPGDTLRRVSDAVTEPFEFEGNLLNSLRRYFPEPLVRWIAACAVYPALHWDLTLYLGRTLSEPKEPSLLSAANLRQLARLPWFVQGRIPENARLQLVEFLAAEGLETTVRQALDQLLRQTPAPPKNSAAWDEYRMNVVLNELLLKPDPAKRRALEQEFERYLAAGKQPDFVTFKRLERQPTALDLLAPESWKKHLFKHGSSRFGWKLPARLLPILIGLGLGIAFLQPVKTRICEGLTANYQGRTLCLADEDARLLYLELLTADAVLQQNHVLADSLANEADRSPADSARLRYFRNTATDYYNFGARAFNASRIAAAAAADSLRNLACGNFQRGSARFTSAQGTGVGIEFFNAQRRACPNNNAPPGTARFDLQGLVLDAASGMPIAGAELRAGDAAAVSLARLRTGAGAGVYKARTDAQGRYRLVGLPPMALIQLYATAPGYDNTTLLAAPSAELSLLRLQPSAAALEAAAWARATAANTPEAYGEYLAKHSNGLNAAEARRRQSEGLGAQERSAWEKTQQQPSIAAYEAYLRQYPNGAFRAEAEAGIAALREAADWNTALGANTEAAYQSYLNSHPQGANAAEARSRLETLREAAAWARATAANTPEAYEAYLGEYPKGPNAAEAARRSGEKWRMAVNIKEMEANMVSIPGGTFTMGCRDKKRDGDCDEDEKPPRPVTLRSFYMGRYEVTQAQWRAVMGSNPPELYNEGCDECPVEGVSWEDVQQFLKKLNALTGQNYRLPSEAEWEYAARGGAKSTDYLYSGSSNIEEVAWYDGNAKAGNTFGSQKTTRPVGGKKPNGLGLYDMSGNVWEWCQDAWHDNYQGAPKDGRAWMDGGDNSRAVLRGGSWLNGGNDCRVANRDRNGRSGRGVNDGFRLARDGAAGGQ
jgi:formylglycine-generating enzyme required for sulfatase activity